MKKEVNKQRGAITGAPRASIGMAIMDALPVLFFSLSIWLIHTLFPSAWFALGAALCILAGLGKVLWKLILAIRGKAVRWLNRQFRILMPTGFALMLLSILIDRNRIDWLAVWQRITMAPVGMLLGIGAALMVLMLVLDLTMDQASTKANWLEQSVNLCAQLSLMLGVCILWYNAQAYPALEGIEKWLQSSESVCVQRLEDGWLFDGPGEDTALVFYPGALVEAEAYAPLLAQLAERGMDAVVYDMPLYTALLDANAADRAMAAWPYQHWYVGGHSLGGLTACSYAASHPQQADGVVLLAAYPNEPIRDAGLKVLSVYGTKDRVQNADRYRAGMALLPGEYTEVVIEGGNHAQFALYGPQKGDGEAAITHEEQWRQTVEAICLFCLAE